MSKRKSINKRMSRYSQRSSAGSGYLDPNSEILEEEKSYWWNNLTNNANLHLARYNATNETSKFLNSDSQIQSTDSISHWWQVIQTSDSSTNEKLIEAVPEEIKKKNITSDTDDEEPALQLRKRKITMRKRLSRKKSNIFLKALDSSESSGSNLAKNPVTQHTNDTSIRNKSLQKMNPTEKDITKISNTSSTVSNDQSHITDKILKPKPIFLRKKNKRKSNSAFENLLKENDDSHHKSRENETMSKHSFVELMEKKEDTSKETILDKSKEENKMSSSRTALFKKSIVSPETSKNDDGNIIYLNRSSSISSILSSNDESINLKLHRTHDTSDKNVSKNLSNNKQKSILENDANLTLHSNTSEQERDSIINEKIESREITNKSETSLASMRHMRTPNKSKMEKSISLRKTINASLHESTDGKNLIDEVNDKNDKLHPISNNVASNNFINLSNSTPAKNNNNLKNTRNSSRILSQSNNIISNATRDRSLTNNNLMKTTKMDDISLKNQINRTNSNDNSLHATSAIENTSKNRTLKGKISTLWETNIHDISDNEEILTKDNTRVKELNTSALSLKHKSLDAMNVVTYDNEPNKDYINEPNNKTSDNTGHQKKINEYFAIRNSKLVSSMNARQSKHFPTTSNTKENKKIKITDAKKQITNSKLIKLRNPLLKRKQIINKILELQNLKEIQKKPTKKEIDQAYIVNGQVYKRPKLPRPQSWVTNRFYQFLWKTMEPKYKLLARVRSEKFVKELSDVVSVIIKVKKYNDYEAILHNLMEHMAKLEIIRTRNDFYNFCHDYLPYDFRVKVVPMILPGNVRNIPYDPKTLNEPILKN